MDEFKNIVNGVIDFISSSFKFILEATVISSIVILSSLLVLFILTAIVVSFMMIISVL